MKLTQICHVACLALAASLLLDAASRAEDRAAGGTKTGYPDTRRSDQVDDYHGTPVADPYRWLEDPDSDETRKWVEAQNKVTFAHLDRIAAREPIERRLTELWNFERFGLPVKRGGKYFYTRNDGLQNQSVLYVADALDAPPRLLLDPNKLSSDGTVALSDWEVSDNGELVAIGLAAGGSDWREWKVLETATGQLRPDHLKWIKFSTTAWSPDNAGFYYSRYAEPEAGQEFTGTNYFQKIYYHRLGEPQAQDRLVYERRDQQEWGFRSRVSEDGHFLIIGVWRGTENNSQIFYQDLRRPDSAIVELIAGFDAEYEFVGNDGEIFFISTDRDAPLRRIMAVDLKRPAFAQWREVIPEGQDVLTSTTLVGGHLVASYLHDAQTAVRVFDLQGQLVREVQLPAIGTAAGFAGKSADPETFFEFSNFTRPTTIYRYDIGTGQSSVFRAPKLKFNPDDFETRQVFYKSKDGTRVPMFITMRKGLEPNGKLPTFLYAYGGFDISLTPSFSVQNVVWLERGGVYALPNLRGGGEYGRTWHEAGMLNNKQNVFDDFIAAAEWLIANGYTSRDKLAVHGRSNGGLLIGAAITQRPDLFGAALPAVGVMDMLRYHKFTIGWAWVNEYGSSDNAEQFANLIKYSPLHNLKAGVRYPSTMVTTADHDDRVVPGHSFKFAAALQHAHRGDNPVLIRIESSAGHGAGTPTSKLIRTAADMLAFLVQELQLEH